MIFDSVPVQFTAGDDISWTANPDAYPPTGYRLSYAFQSEDGLKQITINQQGTSDGLALFTVVGSDSKVYTAGDYYYQLYAFDLTSGARTQIEQGRVKILRDLSQAQAPTQNQRTLQAISDLLEGKASDDIQTCSLNGKNLTAYSLTELTNFKSYFQGLVTVEINKRRTDAGFRSKRTIKVRFSSSSGRWPSNGPFIPGY